MELMHIGIVIPIYKSELSDKEKLSVSQAFKVLKKYKFFFVAPRNLNSINYERYFEPYHHQFIRFDDKYFYQGLEGYNDLLLSEDFYKTFSEFKYILIYQPDAYVFRDELMKWCKEGYDYIGAPWLEDKDEKIKLNGVGNGGFSLRNIKKFLYIFSKCKIRTINDNSRIKHRFHKIQNQTIALRSKLLNLIGNKKVVYYRKTKFNEDEFWGLIAPKISGRYKTAPAEEAVKFSFDGKSAPCRHPIPVQVGTLIRNMPAGDSGASRQVFVI